MERSEVISRERLSHDPLYAHAQKVAEWSLRNFQKTTEGHLDYARVEIDRYRSASMRMTFLDALRAELLLWMEDHRKTCNELKCEREQRYAGLVYLIKDELEALNPAVSSREPDSSITRSEADRLNEIKNELLDAILGGDERILEVQRLTLEGVMEALDELWDKMPYGKKDWSAIARTYLTKKLVEQGVDAALIAPFIVQIEKALGQFSVHG